MRTESKAGSGVGRSTASGIAVSVVIPAYNEEACITQTLDEVSRYFEGRGEPWELIVVDDGSQDRTAERVKAVCSRCPNVRHLRHDMNRGKGAAARTGTLATLGEKILFTDADLSTPIDAFARFAAAIDEGADIAIGSRRVAGATIARHQPFYREKMGSAFTILANLILGTRISDFTCGFKVFSRRAAHALFVSQRRDDWSYDAEILFLAVRGGWRVKEIPVWWADNPDSKVRVGRAAVSALYGLLSTRLNGGSLAVRAPCRAESPTEKPRASGTENDLGFQAEAPPSRMP